MRKASFLFLSLFLSLQITAQIPAYYNDVDLTLSGMDLKEELSYKITVTHTNTLSYGELWNVLRQTDLNPDNSADVLLIYGYNDSDGILSTDRTRNKYDNGGSVGEWNREHVYAKSLGTPNLGTSNAGADAHHIRSASVQMNGHRGSKRFAVGTGDPGPVSGNWYPGDEWKGDVARMIMYMYLRYPTQCRPNNVGVGVSVAIDPAMIELFLQWNATDSVSQYEINRNNVLENEQGNRNPFIDNPKLATIIWGGNAAQDNWHLITSVPEYDMSDNISVYPMPATDGQIHLYMEDDLKVDEVILYSISGQMISKRNHPNTVNRELVFEDVAQGFYLLSIRADQQLITKKVVVN